MKQISKLRQTNKTTVLKALYELGPSTKNQISEYTELSVGTCFNVLQELLESNEVILGEDFASTGGRKAKCYEINKNYAYNLTISMVRVYEEIQYTINIYNLIDEKIDSYTSNYSVIDFNKLLDDISSVMNQYLNVISIVIALPGFVDKDGYLNEMCLNYGLEKLREISLTQELSQRFHCHVIVENDVNVMAYGYYALHKECDTFGFIYQPEKELAGGAYVYQGELVKGKHGFLGEIGYLVNLNRSQQLQDLENDNIHTLLAHFMHTMQVMYDPDYIIVYCPMIKDIDISKSLLLQNLPHESLLSDIIFIEDINTYLEYGLIKLANTFKGENYGS
ncbi:MAG: ROK family protein [Erysipelotrichaceae bacterium]|nr:ROK family protein [Erysipelotrichaceae bacterium]